MLAQDDVLPRPTTARALPVAACAGIVIVVVGTFLPWLDSGQVNRNSYAAAGAIRTALDIDGAAGAALRVWPFVSLVGAIAVALTVVGAIRVGGGLAAITALVAGGVAVTLLNTDGRGIVHVDEAGPLVTAAGAALTVLAVAAYLLHTFHTSVLLRRPQ